MTYDRQRAEALNADHHRRMAAESPMHEQDHLDKDAASRAAIVHRMAECFGSDVRLTQVRGPRIEKPRVLEIGAGFGGDRRYLEIHLGAEYTGIELVKSVAERAEHVLHLPLEEAPKGWDGRFSYIYSRHVMEHVLDLDLAMKTLRRLLARGGVIGAVTPHYFPDPEPAHVTQLRIDEWKKIYRSYGFTELHASIRRFACVEAHLVYGLA